MWDRRYIRWAYLMVFSPVWVPVVGLGPWWLAWKFVIMKAALAAPAAPLVLGAVIAWVVLPLLVIIGTILVCLRWTKRVREGTARAGELPCLNCGHTLLLNEPRCPECGVVVEAAKATAAWKRFAMLARMRLA